MRGIEIPVIFFLLALVIQMQACEVDKMGTGCRIFSGQCSCGYGCKAEYRYPNMEECKLALTGKRNNACHIETRCLHSGTCLQITSSPGYKCLCDGTGYYGPRCEKPCPGPEYPHPLECIVI